MTGAGRTKGRTLPPAARGLLSGRTTEKVLTPDRVPQPLKGGERGTTTPGKTRIEQGWQMVAYKPRERKARAKAMGDAKHIGQYLAMLERHGAPQVHIPQALIDAIVPTIAQLITSDSRNKRAALRELGGFLKYNAENVANARRALDQGEGSPVTMNNQVTLQLDLDERGKPSPPV